MENKDNKVGLIGLISLTVTAVIGGGIFNLMSDMAKTSHIGPIIVALTFSGIGMALFCISLSQMSRDYPELEAGIFSFAGKGFGSYVAFNSMIGFWASNFLGNVAFATFVFSALGYFFPIFGNGQNLASVIGASCCLWLMHFIILRGANFASKINTVLTAIKLIPLLIFIVCLIIAFDYNMFSQNFWVGTGSNITLDSVLPQIRGALASSIWVYLGIEGTIAFSARARNKADLGKALIVSFTLVTSIYLLVLVLSFAVMSRPELAGLGKPAMAHVLEEVIGPIGAKIINFGVVVSTLGTWFASNMFCGEICYQAAKSKVMPRFLLKENRHQAPVNGLLLSNSLIQALLLLLLVSKNAYNFMALLASGAMLVPYFFVSAAHMKLSFLRNHKRLNSRTIYGLLSSVFFVFCMWALGFDYLLLMSILFASFIFVFVIAQKQNQEVIFTKNEMISAIIISLLALFTIYLIFKGVIDVANM